MYVLMYSAQQGQWLIFLDEYQVLRIFLVHIDMIGVYTPYDTLGTVVATTKTSARVLAIHFSIERVNYNNTHTYTLQLAREKKNSRQVYSGKNNMGTHQTSPRWSINILYFELLYINIYICILIVVTLECCYY